VNLTALPQNPRLFILYNRAYTPRDAMPSL